MRYLFTLCGFLYGLTMSAQTAVGNWEGSLEVQGTELPIIFHISKDDAGNYSASFDSPLQQVYDNACSEATVIADSVILKMDKIKGIYAAKLNAEKNLLTGTWSQSGYTFPLQMKKTNSSASKTKINRPQTPKPPFPYKSEDITYSNQDKSMNYGATITVPLPDPNVEYFRAPVYPTVILITGSGPQDRDEMIFQHRPFAVIADYLTRQGIAVLRVDDRGIGKTTGVFNTSTTADFAKDVEAGINYLKTRDDVDINGIGLIGHSEGGIIAPMVASERSDVRFIILLAGPGFTIIDMMEQQSADVMASQGISQEDINQYRPLYKATVNAIINAKDSTSASQQAIAVFKKWEKGKSAASIKNTTGVTGEKDITGFTNAFIRELSSPWFKYFMKMNPQQYLSKVHCPVLALNGEKDIQVAAKQNLAGIKAALAKNKNGNYKVEMRPGLNHLFQHCKTCIVQEYGELEETFDTETLKIMADWIKNEAFK